MAKNVIKDSASELLARRKARESIVEFIKYMKPCGLVDVEHEPVEHHLLIIEKIEEMVRGMENKDPDALHKFMLSVPPASAKSTYISVIAPCWMLARNPKIQILALANSDQLAEKFSRSRRTLMKTKQWEAIAQTSLDKDAQSLKYQATPQGGFIRSASAGAVITGFRCQVLLCDDLVPSFEFAQSEGQLLKLWNWFETEARSRLAPNGIQFIIGTRWSVNEPIGKLLKRKNDGDEEIEYMRIPMECDDPTADPLGRALGERLWKNWFTPRMVADAKRSPLMWRCLYQQKPSDEAGRWCSYEHFITETTPPANLTIVMAIDIALSLGKGDYSVITIAGMDSDRMLHVIDVWREQVTPDTIADQVIRMTDRYKPAVALIDNDNGSKVWMSVLQQKCKEASVYTPIQMMPLSNRDKESRASVLRSILVQDLVRFKQANWTPAVLDEILTFPSGKNDDIIDCLSLTARYMNKLSAPTKQTKQPDIQYQMQLGIDGQVQMTESLDALFKSNESNKLSLINRMRI